MKILKFVLLLCLLPAIAAANDGWTPFEVVDGDLLIPARIGTHEVRALITGGSNVIAISQEFIENKGIPVQTSGLTTITTGPEDFMVENLTRFEFEVFDQAVRLNNVALMPGMSSEIMLGKNFFHKVLVQLDYTRQRLRYLPRKAIKLKDYANVDIKQQDFAGEPLMSVELPDGKPLWLGFVGSPFSEMYLDRDVAIRRGWLETLPVTQKDIDHGGGHSATFDHFVLPSIKMGPYTLENVAVIVPSEEQQRLINKESGRTVSTVWYGQTARGSIGLDLLKHFVLTVDYKKNLLHIEAP